MLGTGGNIVGNSAGGVLFQVLGAAFLFSAASLLFARVPRIEYAQEKLHFSADLRSGFAFVWRIRGLRLLVLTAAVLNFFASMAIVLILPFYQRNPGLGPVKYGIAMAVLTGGMFLGMALTSVVKIPAAKRHFWFLWCGAVSMACLVAFPFVGSFGLAIALLALAGFANAILNVFIMAVKQLAVPQGMRGKVFALMGMITQGLTPIAFALAGALAEFLPLAPLISVCFGLAILVGLPMMFTGVFRRFIDFDPERDTIDAVR